MGILPEANTLATFTFYDGFEVQVAAQSKGVTMRISWTVTQMELAAMAVVKYSTDLVPLLHGLMMLVRIRLLILKATTGF